ncbi:MULTISPECIES: 30S ribosomal protein S6 [Dyadobacter]|jgi:small subunit ribosomal protein S6|uniref:Small ribosomal subunit protein bS6 n=3 Tax=Dyadobacter TaxID=120831 RepID=A0A1G7UUE9_9BACT|nr:MULTISPECIES: 30S ribosomal protein S6 [Dyadobacter]MBO9611535.1 30S ribosomal protein S6 [Dyadobacter sp.]MBZ1360331.1 30S ribosomal protein S6 [Dyadobacter fermentans]MDR6808751.1 small subunit ribosomal protein S6 [Dyadobacter fermentans]MDR7046494.1 small subunit ribosomal protein S6 [Dyadobacter sp. BE242]MDR7200807.1 small subunit ribosomal protein S6 [Dyadobacter sp. BE34]
MSKQYETVFILTPILSEAQAKDAVEKFTTIITSNGAKIVHEENWGLRKLAYPIQKKNSGFYHVVEYTANEGNVVDVLETEFRRDERVLRFMTIALDKHSIAYNEKKRKGLVGKKKEEATESKTENA